jgi:F1F0 ATPase subunit 2
VIDVGVSGAVALLASFVAGGLIGLLFFGGLWLTVRGMNRARRPALRIMASLLLRLCLVLGAFFLLIRYGGWQHAVMAVLGFALLRFAVIRGARIRRPEQESDA